MHRTDDETFRREIGSYLDVGRLPAISLRPPRSCPTSIASSSSGTTTSLYLHPKTNKLHFIPWDLDRAFANFDIVRVPPAQQVDLSLTRPYLGTHRLTDRLLRPRRRWPRQYQKLLKDLAATAFDRERLLKRVAAVEEAVKEPLGRTPRWRPRGRTGWAGSDHPAARRAPAPQRVRREADRVGRGAGGRYVEGVRPHRASRRPPPRTGSRRSPSELPVRRAQSSPRDRRGRSACRLGLGLERIYVPTRRGAEHPPVLAAELGRALVPDPERRLAGVESLRRASAAGPPGAAAASGTGAGSGAVTLLKWRWNADGLIPTCSRAPRPGAARRSGPAASGWPARSAGPVPRPRRSAGASPPAGR